MHADEFEDILDEFPQVLDRVKPLCKKIRSILFFLLEGERLNFGTPPAPPEKLYDPIIKAFHDAIAEERARES